MPESDNWCPDIYRSVFIDRINDNKLEVAPCCQADPGTESSDSFNFNTSPYLNDLRQKFARGEKPTACDRCWHAESTGNTSRRQRSIEFFNMPKFDNTVVLEAIDYAATWACNLACVMCGPRSSSTWAKELNFNKTQLYELGRVYQKTNNFLDNIDMQSVKRIHFNGGEPLLNNDQLVMLKKLDQLGRLNQVVISYNTNGTIYPTSELVDLWSKAKLVKIFFSIDGTNKSFEYVRWPGKWSQVENNMLQMKDKLPSNVMFGFNTTVGCYNIFEITDVWQWFNNNLSSNREGDPSDFCLQLAYNFDIKFLRQNCIEPAIEELSKVPQLNEIVAYLNTRVSSDKSDLWITKLNQIDQRRGTSWLDSLKIKQYY